MGGLSGGTFPGPLLHILRFLKACRMQQGVGGEKGPGKN